MTLNATYQLVLRPKNLSVKAQLLLHSRRFALSCGNMGESGIKRKGTNMNNYGQLSFDNMDVPPVRVGGVTLQEKIDQSYKNLKLASEMSHEYYGKPLIVCVSGGKDSDVLLQLAEECLGTDFEVLTSHTTVDAPPTVKHIEKQFKRLEEKGIKTIYKNRYPVKDTMWSLILKRQSMPTRLFRFCCQKLKETGTKDRIAAVGVRASESLGRKGRDIFAIRGKTKQDALYFSYDHAEEVHKESQEINDENWDCTLITTMKKNKDVVVNAIYEWEDRDIWDFIKDRGIEVNLLYEMGFSRVGCILCPMASKTEKMKQIELFPTYKQAYINAAEKLLKSPAFQKRKDVKWKTGEDVFNWWMELDTDQIEGQINMLDFIKGIQNDGE